MGMTSLYPKMLMLSQKVKLMYIKQHTFFLMCSCPSDDLGHLYLTSPLNDQCIKIKGVSMILTMGHSIIYPFSYSTHPFRKHILSTNYNNSEKMKIAVKCAINYMERHQVVQLHYFCYLSVMKCSI